MAAGLWCAGARDGVAGRGGVLGGELVTPYEFCELAAGLWCAGARRGVAGRGGVLGGELVTPYGYGYGFGYFQNWNHFLRLE